MHAVAYSMGGRIALEALLLHGAPFLSLTCLSTTLAIPNPEKRKIQEESWIEQLKSQSLDDFINTWYQNPLFKGFTPPPERYNQKPEDLISVLQNYSFDSLNHPIEAIHKCKTPLHFLYKKNDPKSGAIRNFKNLHFVNALSHSIHIESPKECIDIIQNVKRLPA